MEVQAPKNYRPINEPLLYFTVETIKTNSGKIVNPETGQVVDIKTINVKFPKDDKVYALNTLYMTNPKDSNKRALVKDVDSKDISMSTIVYKSAASEGKAISELTLVAADNHEYSLDRN